MGLNARRICHIFHLANLSSHERNIPVFDWLIFMQGGDWWPDWRMKTMKERFIYSRLGEKGLVY